MEIKKSSRRRTRRFNLSQKVVFSSAIVFTVCSIVMFQNFEVPVLSCRVADASGTILEDSAQAVSECQSICSRQTAAHENVTCHWDEIDISGPHLSSND